MVVDLDGDGASDNAETHSYACFDGAESPQKWPGPCIIDYDANADGQPDATTSLQWDEDGKLLEEISVSAAPDGQVMKRTYQYGERGELLVQEIDSDGDDAPDDALGNDYDESGNLVREWFDNGANGTLDLATEHAHDDDGNVLSDGFYRDGKLVRSTDYERDSMGNVVRQTFTESGSDEGVTIVTSRFDDAGNLVAQAIDDDRNGRDDSCEHYEYCKAVGVASVKPAGLCRPRGTIRSSQLAEHHSTSRPGRDPGSARLNAASVSAAKLASGWSSFWSSARV